MSAPSTHTTPDGSSFRISKVQDMREQSLFLGQKFTFQVEKEAAEGGGAAGVRGQRQLRADRHRNRLAGGPSHARVIMPRRWSSGHSTAATCKTCAISRYQRWRGQDRRPDD